MSGCINKWHYHSAGDPASLPVLLLHGFMGSGRVWLPTMNQLAGQIFAIAPDLPGHGQTEADLETLDFDTLSSDLLDLCDRHFDRPPVIVGYSLGGRAALYAALKYPDRFSALVLESSSAGIEIESERRQRSEQDRQTADRLRSTDMVSFLTEWYQQPLFASLARETVAGIIQKKSGGNRHHFAEAVVRLSPGRQPSLWNRLPDWTKPILILSGALDTKYSQIAQRMAEYMPQARLEIIPDAGHIVHLENNQAFVAALKSFLTTCIL